MSEAHSSHELPSQVVAEAVFNRPVASASAEHAKQVTDVRQAVVPEVNPTEQLQVKAAEIPTFASMQVVIEKNIGSDKTGGKIRRNSEQLRRFNQATEAAQLAVEVLEQGYPGLPEGQKSQIQERVYPAMLRLWPELNTAFTSLTRRQRQKAMEDILMDPEFQREVKTLLESVQTNYKEGAEKTSEEGKLESKNEELEREQARLEELKREVVQAQEKQLSFEKGGKSYRRLEVELPSLPVLDAAIDAASRAITTRREELRKLDSQLNPIAKYEYTTKTDDENKSLQQRAIRLRERKDDLEADIQKLEKTHTDYLAAKKEKEALEDEKKRVIDEEKKTQRDSDEAERKVNKLLQDKLSLQADMGISKLEKDAYEAKFVKEIQNIFATAAERVVERRLTRAQDALTAQKAMKEAHTAENGHGEAISPYINRDGTLKKDKIKSDYRRFMAGSLTDRSEEGTKDLLARYIQAGGKFSKSEIERIANTHAGTELIVEAVEASHKLMEQIVKADQAANPHEEKVHQEPLRKRIGHVISKLPKPTMNQLLIVGGLAAGGFFAGPAIIDAVLPAVKHAAARWSVEAARHKFIADVGHVAKETPGAIAHAADVVHDKLL